MRFRWYHAIIILGSVICVAGLVFFGLRFLNREQSTGELYETRSSESGKTEKKTDKKADKKADKNADKKADKLKESDGNQKETTSESSDGNEETAGQEENAGDNSGGNLAKKVLKPASPVLVVRLTSDDKAELVWKTVTGADYYEVYKYHDNVKKWMREKKTTDLSWQDDYVENRQILRYRVCSVKMDGDSVLRSDYASAKIRADFTVKALVVDKETNSSKRMVKYLKKAGFEVARVESLDEFRVEDYDTLVIPGGHNITPGIYGAERDEHTYGTNEEIDHLQIDAILLFQKAGKPILGVCRGCQVVNVALGGTINQHIPGWHKKYRTVTIDKKSWLYDKLGASESVYHYHHQCVDKLGEGLIATQWDEEDGRIEAIEHETLPIYGIQWHPDSMGDKGVEVFKYYKELVQEYNSKRDN